MKPSKPKAVWVKRTQDLVYFHKHKNWLPCFDVLYESFFKATRLKIEPGQYLKVEFKGRVVK